MSRIYQEKKKKKLKSSQTLKSQGKEEGATKIPGLKVVPVAAAS